VKFWKEQVDPMSAVAGCSAILPMLGFPTGADVHWEKQRRLVWNEQEHTREEQHFPTAASQGERLMATIKHLAANL